MRKLGEEAGEKFGVEFLYRDFREGYKEGVEKSKELGLYRQPYCGCI
ncbi:MAG: epoxyqueuosine reductase QueH [Clostridiaceae bacterium]|nr:epoxyqueuosine reductase QueH [Clostridiaceae bacterium]